MFTQALDKQLSEVSNTNSKLVVIKDYESAFDAVTLIQIP